MHNPVILLFVTIFFYFFSPSSQQTCTTYSCPITHVSHFNNKSSSPSFRLGLVVSLDDDNNNNNIPSANAEGIANFATYLINNDVNLLPGISLDLYSRKTRGKTDTVISTIALITQANVDILISLVDDDNTLSLSEIASLYMKPIISLNSVTTNFTATPYMFRISFPDQYLATTMLQSLLRLNKTEAFYIYTANIYGKAAYDEFKKQSNSLGVVIHGISISIIGETDFMLEMINLFVGRTCNTFIVNVDSDIAIGVMNVLNANGYIGNNYLYFLTSPVYNTLADSNLWNLLQGAFGFEPKQYDSSSPIYQQFINRWSNADSNEFPGEKMPYEGVLARDAVYTIANAIQNFQSSTGSSGVPVSSSSSFLSTIKNVNFDGTSGNVRFDNNNDRIGSYVITNFVNNQRVVVGEYSPSLSSLSFSRSYYFYDNSSDIPVLKSIAGFHCGISLGFGLGYTETGTINSNDPGKCDCFDGYSGNRCELKTVEKKKRTDAVVIVSVLMPTLFVLAAVLLAAFFYYKKRRTQLVEEVKHKQRTMIAREDLKLTDRIGRGASGEVYKALFRGTEVAVKRLVATTTNQAAVEEFNSEMSIMTGLRHPNIVLFMGSCFDVSAKEMFLVMEYHQKGSLYDVLHNMNLSIPMEIQIHIAYQAAQGMNYLHESHPPIIHRDLKSQNILLDDKWNARISDFGITKVKEINKIAEEETQKSKSIGTIFWTAPEVLDGKPCTEKSDCYAFGIVLWEIFHRAEPYNGKEPMAVAFEVIQKNLRPVIDFNIPPNLQELMQDCWAQEPEKRPSFEKIMERLRILTMQHPVYNFGGNENKNNRNEAPSGNVFFVSTEVQSLFSLYDTVPRALQSSMTMLTHLLRSNMELYNGYEVKSENFVNTIAFSSLEKAMNWCISVQISLLNVIWPPEILSTPWARSEITTKGQVIWSGLRVNMCMHQGTPTCELDPSTNRVIYSGAVMERLKTYKEEMKNGMAMSTAVATEMDLQKTSLRFMEDIKVIRKGKGAESGLTYFLPESLFSRSLPSAVATRAELPTQSGEFPNLVQEISQATLEEAEEEEDVFLSSLENEKNNNISSPSWLIKWDEIVMKEHIESGPIGDFYRVLYKGKEVVAKIAVNQKVKEEDLVRLMADASLLSKIQHENLLPFYGICIDPGHVSIFTQYISNGSLREILNNDLIPLSFSQKLKIALQISAGMQKLEKHPDQEIRIFDNLKSNNIMISSEWKVLITDFGQASMKDLATLSTVSNVAWTAPEILSGEKATTSSPVYSFSIILWELITRENPYEGEHPVKVVSKILSGRRPAPPVNCHSNYLQLMESCWTAKPEMRPSWHVIQTELTRMLEEVEED